MIKIARSHNWLIHRIIVDALEDRIRRNARGRLLDIGCGDKPYFDITAPYVDEHIGLDHEATPHDRSQTDLTGTAYRIPTPDDHFDTVLCTDVLEHLEEPAEAIAEAFRVLAPGGKAIYTMPLYWHIHEAPRDFFRYTRFGIQHLFTKAGFEILEIEALTGFTVTFTQQLVYFLLRFRGTSRWNPMRYLVPAVNFLLQRIAFAIHHVEKTERFTSEYLVVATKPEHPPTAP